MKLFKYVCTLILFSQFLLSNAQVIENRIFKSDIRTPLAFPSGNPTGYPMVESYSSSPVEFHFDIMSDSKEDLRYAVYHCESDWSISDISEIEYISGFSNQDITDVEYSFSTAIDFIHYHFDFPNSLSKPTISGNYGIVVYNGDEPLNSPVLTYRMIVYDNLLAITGQVSNSSIVSERFKDQEIDFIVNYGALNISTPSRDLKTVILQNNDWSTAIRNLQPNFINNNEMNFDLAGPNNFKGGSEWRAFEIKSIKFASIQVESIQLENGYWHAYLRHDLERGGKAYQSDYDLNGKTFIRNDLGNDSFLEAEYIYVHFFLEAPEVPGGKMYLEVAETTFHPEEFEMVYDAEKKGYALTKLMKQGYYNYRYKTVDRYHPEGDYSYTEGNHYETENDYHILVYYYDMRRGCDRLVGIAALNSVARN
ncbi:MAG: DUF5103 domain-containing protein [Flavobacteriales bacterium]